MDIKQLIYLCNLERERHFGRAADASFVSQPTLSMQLKNLERELGVALIHRGNSFQGFTAEGEQVLAWVREIVSVYQGLKLEVESLKQGVGDTLRIAVSCPSAVYRCRNCCNRPRRAIQICATRWRCLAPINCWKP